MGLARTVATTVVPLGVLMLLHGCGGSAGNEDGGAVVSPALVGTWFATSVATSQPAMGAEAALPSPGGALRDASEPREPDTLSIGTIRADGSWSFWTSTVRMDWEDGEADCRLSWSEGTMATRGANLTISIGSSSDPAEAGATIAATYSLSGGHLSVVTGDGRTEVYGRCAPVTPLLGTWRLTQRTLDGVPADVAWNEELEVRPDYTFRSASDHQPGSPECGEGVLAVQGDRLLLMLTVSTDAQAVGFWGAASYRVWPTGTLSLTDENEVTTYTRVSGPSSLDSRAAARQLTGGYADPDQGGSPHHGDST